MAPVRLEPAASRSRVKHSTTEPLRSLRKRVYVLFHRKQLAATRHNCLYGKVYSNEINLILNYYYIILFRF